MEVIGKRRRESVRRLDPKSYVQGYGNGGNEDREPTDEQRKQHAWKVYEAACNERPIRSAKPELDAYLLECDYYAKRKERPVQPAAQQLQHIVQEHWIFKRVRELVENGASQSAVCQDLGVKHATRQAIVECYKEVLRRHKHVAPGRNRGHVVRGRIVTDGKPKK